MNVEDSLAPTLPAGVFDSLDEKARERVMETAAEVILDIASALKLPPYQRLVPRQVFSSGMALVISFDILETGKEPFSIVAKIVSEHATPTEVKSIKREVKTLSRIQDILIAAGETGAAFQELLYPMESEPLLVNGNYLMISNFHGIPLTEVKTAEDKLASYLMVALQHAELFRRKIFMLDTHDGNILLVPGKSRTASLTDFGMVYTPDSKEDELTILGKYSPMTELMAEFYNFSTVGQFTYEKELRMREFIIRSMASLALRAITKQSPYKNIPTRVDTEQALRELQALHLKGVPQQAFELVDVNTVASLITSRRDFELRTLGKTKLADITNDKERYAALNSWMERALGHSCGYSIVPWDPAGTQLWNSGIADMIAELMQIVLQTKDTKSL